MNRKNTNFVKVKIIQKLPETVTELHEIPVHWILELETQTNFRLYFSSYVLLSRIDMLAIFQLKKTLFDYKFN